jgi:hypothetical protein
VTAVDRLHNESKASGAVSLETRGKRKKIKVIITPGGV